MANTVSSRGLSLKNAKVVAKQLIALQKSSDPSLPGFSAEPVKDSLREAVGLLKAKAQSYGRGKVPNRVVNAVFTYYDPDRFPKKANSALAGVRKGAPPRLDTNIYKTWKPRRLTERQKFEGRSSSNGLVVGASLSRLYHAGWFKQNGVRRKGYPFFKNAVFATRKVMMKVLANGYKLAMERVLNRV
jgi:hypothetical protein